MDRWRGGSTRRWAIGWLGGAAMLVLACGDVGAPDPADPAHWETIDSGSGRFSVAMPRPPTASVEALETAAGTVELHALRSDTDTEAYSISYVDFPAAPRVEIDSGTLLEGAREGLVTSVAGELLREVRIELDGHAGLEVEYAVGDAGRDTGRDAGLFGRGRLLLVEGRLYQLVVVTRDLAAARGRIDHYLDSFVLAPR